MPLHLIKLSVGTDSVADLEDWIKLKLKERKRKGQKPERIHTTRMVPKRRDEVLDGGSLYWVIKGYTAVRQPLIDVRPFVDGEGVSRCHLVYGQEMVLVSPRPRRAFQGWRYLDPKDAPPDIGKGASGEMPDKLRRELAELGLL